jgi:predicted CoA-binding protein
MVPSPTVAILGASADRAKFGNKSVRAHLRCGYEVYPVNPKAASIEGLAAYPSLRDIPAGRLDRISVYLPPSVVLTLLPEIALAQAGEVWFNPGSETRDLLESARDLGINAIAGCSIVDLGVSPAEFSDE